MTWLRTVASIAVLGLAVAGRAVPQSDLRELRRWEGPEASLNLALGVGQGPYRDFLEVAGGLGGHVAVPFALDGSLGARADLSVLFHGFETWSGSPPINTESYITSLRVGPQLALGSGRLRLYGFLAGGFSYFATDADPQDPCDCTFTETLHDDLTWVTELGVGVRFALTGPSSNVALDLGVRGMRNGEASFVTQDGITQNPDGSFTIRPTRSPVSLLVFHLGVSGSLR